MTEENLPEPIPKPDKIAEQPTTLNHVPPEVDKLARIVDNELKDPEPDHELPPIGKAVFRVMNWIVEGKPVAKSCNSARVSQHRYYKTVNAPHGKAVMERLKFEKIREVEWEHSLYKAQALRVAAELMINSKSDTVKIRCVEFFHRDSKPSVVINNNTAMISEGYEYTRPNSAAEIEEPRGRPRKHTKI